MAQRIDVQKYIPLIVKKAVWAWKRLPFQSRNWISVDDLIQDGILHAKYHVAPRFNSRKANFLTFLNVSLENHFKLFLNEQYTQKRSGCPVYPIATCKYQIADSPDQMEREVQAVEMLQKILGEASWVLKLYLERWLFTKASYHMRGPKFYEAKAELLFLSSRVGLRRDDFAFLLQTDNWRRRLTLARYNPVR